MRNEKAKTRSRKVAGFFVRGYCWGSYCAQSEPTVSPPEGVKANHQVLPLMLVETERTLASAKQVDMMPE